MRGGFSRFIPCKKSCALSRRPCGWLAAGGGAGPVLQHRRPFGAADPRRLRQHERQAAERRDPHRGGAARDQGRRRLHPRAGAAFAAHVWRAVAVEPEELPGHPSRRAVRPGERGRRRHHDAVDAAKAQGYTPIAYSLGQAANDFPADAKERVIVLVSDGKETCQGDPVVAAKALAAKGITVHTVGFIVDTAARGQLQAIAQATGGTYFDAPVGPELPDTLKSGAQRLQEAGRHPAAEAAARQAAHDVGDLLLTTSSMPRPAKRSRHSTVCAPRSSCRPASTRSNSDREAGRGSRCAPGETTTIAAGGIEGRGQRTTCLSTPALSIPKPARSMEISTPWRRR